MVAVMDSNRLNTFLAFAFGVTFCGVLAYAGLREHPITNDAQFWLLRLLAALSAAGVAAVIPGFLDFDWKLGTKIAVRSGGALAVFALVYLVNPPILAKQVLSEDVASMQYNYADRKYNDAERYADKILRIDPNYAKALNIKGGIAYYRRDFEKAREYFDKATQNDPSNDVYVSNLAYAQIETGASLLALQTVELIKDRKADWYYLKGRAAFYAAQYESARTSLQAVGSDYFHGAAHVLMAAAILAHDGRDASHAAREQFQLALKSDGSYWRSILSGAYVEPSQTYDLPLTVLRPVINKQMALIGD